MPAKARTREVVILDGARTPFGDFCGALRDIGANDLGAIAAKAAIERSGVRPKDVDHVIMGSALQSAGDSIYGARHVALKSGLSIEVPAVTVNQVCGSGMQALLHGAQLIRLGEAEVCLVGGMENMSQVPHVMRGARWKLPMGRSEIEDSLLVSMVDSYINMPLAITAEHLADRYNLTRQEQDEYALRSMNAAIKARDNGWLKEEITPIALKEGKGEEHWNDERIQETTLDRLSKEKPTYKKDGGVTAANSAGISDGAAALVITSAKKAAKLGLKPKALLISYATCGVDPGFMGLGAVPALYKAIDKQGLKISELDVIEINEAYAAQYLAVEKEMGLDREKVNVNGGAIAIGHPLGATGARLVLTLMYEMRRRGSIWGGAAMGIGGGQGIAVVLEGMAESGKEETPENE